MRSRALCGSAKATPSGRVSAGSGKPRRSTLPLGVSGSAATGTNAAGSSGSGSRSRRKARRSDAPGASIPSCGTIQAISRRSSPRARPAGVHDRVAQRRVEAQGGLDLPGLDAVAADLELAVGAPGEDQVAVGPEDRQVARAVEAVARLTGRDRARTARP